MQRHPPNSQRILQTLTIKHLVFFLSEEGCASDAGISPGFRLKKAMGQNPRLTMARQTGVSHDELDLSFLDASRDRELPEPYLFFEHTRHRDW